MKKNTVILDVKEYNELMDINNGKNNGNLEYVDVFLGTIYYREGTEAIKALKKKCETLRDQDNPVESINNKDIYDVSKMTLWQFIKWRYIFNNNVAKGQKNE